MRGLSATAHAVIALLALACGIARANGEGCGEMPSWLPSATDGSDVVVIGEVVHVDLEEVHVWVSNMVTHITLRVGTVLKGTAPSDSLVFWTVFDVKKDEGYDLRSSPQFAEYAAGDSVVVFVEADAARAPYSRGMGLEITGNLARTPDEALFRQGGVSLECYESWVDSLVSSRSPRSLSRVADAVAVIRVESVAKRETRESPDLERVTGLVLRSLKGPEVGAGVVIALPAHQLWDVATLSPEDTALVFLKLRDDGAYRVLGGRAGVYLLDENAGRCHLSPRRGLIPAIPGEPHRAITALDTSVPFDDLLRHAEQGAD